MKRAVEVARMIAQIQARGWVWRDCKPSNIIVSKTGQLRPVDFEGACLVNQPDPLPWGTIGFSAPEMNNPFRGHSRHPEDLYALGVITYFLLAGRLPDENTPLPLEKMRKNVPAIVTRLVSELLNPEPWGRPSAHAAALRLEAALKLSISSGLKSAA
jgi:serine/threonine protein kinase